MPIIEFKSPLTPLYKRGGNKCKPPHLKRGIEGDFHEENNKTIILIAVFVLTFVLCNVKSAYSRDGWETNIIVSAGVAENRLSLGQRADATDGKDGKYDVFAMLGGDIKASFEGSLWRDIKANDGQKSWFINVESALEGQDINLEWKASGFPQGYDVALVDREAGRSVNMTTTDIYTFRNTGPRGIAIVVTPPAETNDINAQTLETAADTDIASSQVDSVLSDVGGESADFVGNDETVQKEKVYVRIMLPPNPSGWSDEEEIGKDEEEDGFTELVQIRENVYVEGYNETDYTFAELDDLFDPEVSKPHAPYELDGRISEKRKRLHLFWKDDASNEHAFIVERKPESGEKWDAIAVIWNGDRSYDDRVKLPADKVIIYRVMAANSVGWSGYSNLISFGPNGIEKIAPLSKEKEEKMETARTADVNKKRSQHHEFDEASL